VFGVCVEGAEYCMGLFYATCVCVWCVCVVWALMGSTFESMLTKRVLAYPKARSTYFFLTTHITLMKHHVRLSVVGMRTPPRLVNRQLTEITSHCSAYGGGESATRLYGRTVRTANRTCREDAFLTPTSISPLCPPPAPAAARRASVAI
jgi:hypothetical protein